MKNITEAGKILSVSSAVAIYNSMILRLIAVWIYRTLGLRITQAFQGFYLISNLPAAVTRGERKEQQMKRNIQQIKAIEKKNKERLLAVNPGLDEGSGIYFLLRNDENGIRYAYIGQALHILTRLAQHLSGYQHIDLSLKKRGLYDAEKNPYGWKVFTMHYPSSQLDEREKHHIQKYALNGYQLLNKTAGGQGEGKSQISEYRPAKGYRDGLKQGYKNASREIANLFEKHLNVSRKSEKPNKVQEKALGKFMDFLNFHRAESEEQESV